MFGGVVNELVVGGYVYIFVGIEWFLLNISD